MLAIPNLDIFLLKKNIELWLDIKEIYQQKKFTCFKCEKVWQMIVFLTFYHNFCLYEQSVYGNNQSGCEKLNNLGFVPFNLWVFLTIYIFVALMIITMCFKQLKASHIMSWDS